MTSAALQSGDSNCPNGGSSFTSASGTTYACTGNAVAYAEVSSSGVGINPHILGGYNVISATNPSTGLYCLTLSVHPHVGVASNNGDGGGAVMSVVPPAGSQCDAYVYSYADASTARGLLRTP